MTGIQTIDAMVDDMQFKILQFKWEVSLRLEAETIKILSPLISALKLEKGLDSEISMGEIGTAIQQVVIALENPFEFMQKMFENTTYIEGNKHYHLKEREIMNNVFQGKTMTAIKLLIEVMKANNFAFIGGLGGMGLSIDL